MGVRYGHGCKTMHHWYLTFAHALAVNTFYIVLHRFTMFYHGLPCFTMFYHVLPSLVLPLSFPLMSCGTPSFTPCHVSVSLGLICPCPNSCLFLSISFPNRKRRHFPTNGNLRPSFLRARHVCSLTSFRAVQRTQRACHLQMSLATSWMIPGQTIG